MLTQKDIQEIKTIFKEEFDEQYEKRFKYLPTKDEFFTKMDEVMGELKKVRESQESHASDHQRIDRRLENLEEHTGIATA